MGLVDKALSVLKLTNLGRHAGDFGDFVPAVHGPTALLHVEIVLPGHTIADGADEYAEARAGNENGV